MVKYISDTVKLALNLVKKVTVEFHSRSEAHSSLPSDAQVRVLVSRFPGQSRPSIFYF